LAAAAFNQVSEIFIFPIAFDRPVRTTAVTKVSHVLRSLNEPGGSTHTLLRHQASEIV